MKKTLSIALFLTLGLSGMAQETNKPQPASSDTVIYAKGRKFVINEADKKLNVKVYGKTAKGDTISDDMVYEATYNDEQTTERRFEFSIPFYKKKQYHYFESHAAGFYMGFCEMNDNFGLGNSDKVNLTLSHSWELGLNLISGKIKLTNDGHWGITSALGWGYRAFRLDGNYAFREKDGTTIIDAGSTGNEYAVSKLRYYFWRLPISLEWQTKIGSRLFIAGGLEPEWRFAIKSRGRLNGDKATFDRNLNVYPIGLNTLFQAGYGDVGCYLRCSIDKMFKNNHGPKIFPCSFGMMLYF